MALAGAGATVIALVSSHNGSAQNMHVAMPRLSVATATSHVMLYYQLKSCPAACYVSVCVSVCVLLRCGGGLFVSWEMETPKKITSFHMFCQLT